MQPQTEGQETDGEERGVQKAEPGCLRNLCKEQTEGKSDAAEDLKQCIAAGAKDFNRLHKAVSGEVLALPYLRLKLVNALTVSIRKIHIKPFFAEYGLHIGIKSGFLRFAPMLQNPH